MEDENRISRALRLFEKAYERQSSGDLDTAVDLYKASIAEAPTAEAHTYLGWTYSFQGRYDEAIVECKRAITVDPQFGNPYNDIGSYLIQMGQHDQAIPWLQMAKKAERYEPRHFPYLNLFRIYMKKGELDAAQREIEQAKFIQQRQEMADGTLEDEDGEIPIVH
ncbi:MAG TPA: tetratricopeptide repeat protein [Candidatus Polarisedimenticolia bacterium]|nr:tetratricopeptide repeat protein [Candidatus Polarisedimenticolia bacterium]